MIIKAIIEDVTKTTDPDFIKYSDDAVNNGIKADRYEYGVVWDSVIIGTATINYNFPRLEIVAKCVGMIQQESAKNYILERSELVWEADENHVITNWDLCNFTHFTLRNIKDGEVSNIVEFSNE